jgi:hypothetical protein
MGKNLNHKLKFVTVDWNEHNSLSIRFTKNELVDLIIQRCPSIEKHGLTITLKMSPDSAVRWFL